MGRTLGLTSFLILGLVLSQALPAFFDTLPPWFFLLTQFLTMSLLSFIMIEVGREFDIDLKHKGKYAVDYGVAATAAAFPWIFCTIYFLLFLMPEQSHSGRPLWIEALLAGRFAAPTSAGVLFSMLIAAGLAHTWTFKKVRILAIFDDLDTIMFMIPLKALMAGLVWQLGAAVFTMTLLALLSWRFYRRIDLPTGWPWILTYALIVTAFSEALYAFTKDPATLIGVHVEVLFPAFLFGCVLKPHLSEKAALPEENVSAKGSGEKANLIISSGFMLLVGLSMPAAFGKDAAISFDMSFAEIALHVFAVTILSNIGKMFSAFCYRKEASLKERLAVSIAMFPRGEVGAGVLAVSLSYGIQGPFVTIGFLSLALNLMLTGLFIYFVKRLISVEGDALPAEIHPKEA